MAGTVSIALHALENLYKRVEDHLNSPLTQKVLSCPQHEQWAGELINLSLPLLDACDIVKDMSTQIKEHVRDLQSTLRRRKWDLSIETSMAKYTSLRRKMKKEGKKLLSTLKEVDKKIIDLRPLLDIDNERVLVISVLEEVNEISVCIFKSMVLFFCVPVFKPKMNRWSLVSRLGQKGNLNELEGLDSELWRLCRCGLGERDERLKIAQDRLEGVEGWIEGIESGLEYVFRRLIRTRASLLNIISY